MDLCSLWSLHHGFSIKVLSGVLLFSSPNYIRIYINRFTGLITDQCVPSTRWWKFQQQAQIKASALRSTTKHNRMEAKITDSQLSIKSFTSEITVDRKPMDLHTAWSRFQRRHDSVSQQDGSVHDLGVVPVSFSHAGVCWNKSHLWWHHWKNLS